MVDNRDAQLFIGDDGIGPDAVVSILLDTVAASMDRDVARIAEVTKPLYFGGSQADQYAFLSGLLEVVGQIGGPELAAGQFVALKVFGHAQPEHVDWGRLLAAHVNGDGEMRLALWSDVTRDDRRAAAVLAHAIYEAGRVMRDKKAAEQ